MAFDISQLNSPRASDQLSALRSLKNEIVGHIQKKEQWVQAGVLRPIVKIIEGSSDRVNSRDTRQQYGVSRGSADEEAVRLHALQLLASFANAGAAFLPPLHSAGALSAILSRSYLQHDRPQIVLAALRLLRGIADSAAFAPTFSPISTTSIADTIFSNSHIESFALILTQPNVNREVEAQVSIVAKLISTLCREERHQFSLVNYGVLDALATKLASFAVAEGQVIPCAEMIGRSEGLSDFIPGPAKPGLSMADVLGAIAAVITDSPFRTCRFLYSPSILAVFPNTDSEWGLYSRTPPDSLELAGLKPTRQKEYEPMDLLLPYMPSQSRTQSTQGAAFPSQGISTSRDTNMLNSRTTSRLNNHSIPTWNSNDEPFVTVGETDAEEAESPLIPWLIGLVRTHDGIAALMAASVLTSLFKCGFAYKMRENTLGLLVVPKLLHLLNSAEEKANINDVATVDAETASTWDIIERTPATLARLITDSEPLQKAAFDSNAVKRICKLLRSTYDTPPPLTQAQPWSPHGEDEQMPLNISPGCELGEPGQHPLLIHRIKVREGTLKALGALATFKEEYRKAIVDQNVIPCVVESLSQFPTQPDLPKEKATISANTQDRASSASDFGSNPVSVNVAACYAIRMLSRSVNVLRTSLVDHAAALPLYKLLRHPDLDVQNAATAALCNLVTEFSPMRDTLTEEGILEVLCEHARSVSAPLRLNALWALKHLVHSASIELKKECLEELQSGWLVQLICDDTEDEALFSARTRSEKQAQSIWDDVDENMDLDDVSRSFHKHSSARIPSDSRILRLADARLAALLEAELNPVRKARQDDLQIQEQGLGFIRNLIGGAHSSSSADSTNDTTEMIDYLFNTLGQDQFFDILANKLRVKVLHPFSGRRGPTGSETRVLYPQAKIIEAVIYILVHVAASIPRHRQLVVAQTELLRLLAGLFNSQEGEVRVALCHLISNLTWQDDVSDHSACSQRSSELKKLGFMTKLESLGQSDDELDVRERAKSALWQMKHGY